MKIIDFIVSADMRRRDMQPGQKAMIYLDIMQDKQAALAATAKERQREAGQHGKEGGRGERNPPGQVAGRVSRGKSASSLPPISVSAAEP